MTARNPSFQGLVCLLFLTAVGRAQPLAPPPQPLVPGYLGLVVADAVEGAAGLPIVRVAPGGPADQGGLRAGERLVSVGGSALRLASELGPLVEANPPGTQFPLRVAGISGEREALVTLGTRPAPGERLAPEFGRVVPGVVPNTVPGQPSRGNRPLLGIQAYPRFDPVRRLQGLPPPAGVVVSGVFAGSPAAQAGIEPQAVLLAINGQPIRTPDELAFHLQQAGPGGEVEVQFEQRGQRFARRVRLETDVVPETLPVPRTVQRSPLAQVIEPAPVAPNEPAPTAEAERIAALRRQVLELEARIRMLERELAARRGGANP